MSDMIKKARSNAVLSSILLCVIGLILVIWPGMSANIVGVIVGITLMLLGISRLLSYYSRFAFRFVFQWDLILGVVLIVLGIILVTGPQGLMKLLSIAIGIAVLVDGLSKIQTALAAKRLGVGHWFLVLLFAMLCVIVGIVLIANCGKGARAIMTVLGISLIIDGFSGLIAASSIDGDGIIDV